MRRTLLVAMRELMENVRTKGFWLGLLLFPVLLALMSVVPQLLERVKAPRDYAVIDGSGWLLTAIDERAKSDDALRLLRFVQRRARAGDQAVAALPSSLRALANQVKDLGPTQLQTLARTLTAAGATLAPQAADLPPGSEAAVADAVSWMLTLSPEEARELGAGVSRETWVRREPHAAAAAFGEEELRTMMDAKKDGLFAYFVIGPDPLDAAAGGHKYVSNNRTDVELREWFSRLASEEVSARRFRSEGIDADVAARIQRPLVFEEKRLDAKGDESEVLAADRFRQWAPVGFVYVLWIAIFTAANMLLTNTVEEKSTRVIEVLLSSVSPLQLMAGKVLGIAATGLAIVVAWVACLLVELKYLPALLGASREIDLGALIGDPALLASFVSYFVLGYLFYAAVLVAVGSVCNSLKDAQNLMGPIMLIMFVPFVAMVPVTRDPNGMLARVLSFIPPFTPFTMMNRTAGPPQAWEYVATTVLMIGSIAVAFWLAAKIFRVGILMTGKPPRPGEILRWVRAPVGAVPARRD